jgi:hypothetical protein
MFVLLSLWICAMSLSSAPSLSSRLPAPFPVGVVVRRATSRNPWQDASWGVAGVLAGRQAAARSGPRLLRESDAEALYLWGGLAVELFRDQGESYYFNLAGESPRAFVVCHRDDRHGLRPVRVTLSYDEATSHFEGDEEVFDAPMPPELVAWLERFVLSHYVPEKKTKRRRADWRAGNAPPR